GDGTYTVSWWAGAGLPTGPWTTTVTVDDVFPSRDGGPAFARPGDGGEVWVMVLEKAYAESHGGYKPMGQGGWADGPLATLTGRPVETLQAPGLQKVVHNLDPIDFVLTGDYSFETIAARWRAGNAVVAGSHLEPGDPLAGGAQPIVSDH